MIDQHSGNVQDLQIQVEKKNSIIECCETKTREQTDEISDLPNCLSDVKHINQLVADTFSGTNVSLASKLDECQHLEKTLSENKIAAQKLEERLRKKASKLQKNINQLALTLQEKNSRIESLISCLTEKDGNLGGNQREIENFNVHLSEMSSTLLENDESLKISDELEEKEAKLNLLVKEMEKLHQQIEESIMLKNELTSQLLETNIYWRCKRKNEELEKKNFKFRMAV